MDTSHFAGFADNEIDVYTRPRIPFSFAFEFRIMNIFIEIIYQSKLHLRGTQAFPVQLFCPKVVG